MVAKKWNQGRYKVKWVEWTLGKQTGAERQTKQPSSKQAGRQATTAGRAKLQAFGF
jgi:hypothetical protein